MSQKPTICLTGGSGLLALNWFYSKRAEYSVHLVLNERKILPKGAHVLTLDLRSEVDVFKYLKKLCPSYVIHTAGLTSVEQCEMFPELAFQINVELSAIVARVTKALSIPLVHISTDHLFAGTDAMLNEESVPHAVNVYGQTKALAESAVLQINPSALVVRTNFFGWGTSYRASFSDYIIQSLRNSRSIQLFDDVYYTPILTEILIQTIHDLLNINAHGIYNIVSNERVSKYEFGVLLAEKFNLDKSLIFKSSLRANNSLVQRPMDMSLSNKKVSKLLNVDMSTVEQHISRLCEKEQEVETYEMKLL